MASDDRRLALLAIVERALLGTRLLLVELEFARMSSSYFVIAVHARGLAFAALLLLSCSTDPAASPDRGGAGMQSRSGGTQGLGSGGAASLSGGAGVPVTGGAAGSAAAGTGSTAGMGTLSGGADNGGAGAGPYTPGPGRFEPPSGKTLLIIGQDTQPMQEYISALTDVPAGFMTYTTISYLNGFGLPTLGTAPDRMDFDYWPQNHEGIVMQVALAMNDSATVNATANGAYDAALDTLSAHFKAAGVPVFLRVEYEVQGKFPAQGYPEAFRHVRQRLESNGVTNVAFVWHVTPGYTVNGKSNHFDWYPGDEYVDWIAISFFLDVVGRYAPNDASQSGVLDPDTFATVQSNLAMISGYARDHHIPLMIAESAPQKTFEPANGQAAWDGWYTPLFAYIEQYDVKALCYINERWADFAWPEAIWGDSRVQTNALVLDHWQAKVSAPRFLHSNADLYKMLGFPR
jgi:glycosyl hydrolase family 26